MSDQPQKKIWGIDPFDWPPGSYCFVEDGIHFYTLDGGRRFFHIDDPPIMGNAMIRLRPDLMWLCYDCYVYWGPISETSRKCPLCQKETQGRSAPEALDCGKFSNTHPNIFDGREFKHFSNGIQPLPERVIAIYKSNHRTTLQHVKHGHTIPSCTRLSIASKIREEPRMYPDQPIPVIDDAARQRAKTHTELSAEDLETEVDRIIQQATEHGFYSLVQAEINTLAFRGAMNCPMELRNEKL